MKNIMSYTCYEEAKALRGCCKFFHDYTRTLRCCIYLLINPPLSPHPYYSLSLSTPLLLPLSLHTLITLSLSLHTLNTHLVTYTFNTHPLYPLHLNTFHDYTRTLRCCIYILTSLHTHLFLNTPSLYPPSLNTLHDCTRTYLIFLLLPPSFNTHTLNTPSPILNTHL